MPFSNGFLTEFEKLGCKWIGFRSMEGDEITLKGKLSYCFRQISQDRERQ